MTTGLYGNTTTFGGTYFEWFVFQQSATAPLTPTGGSWDFQENTGLAPTGWTTAPPVSPTNTVWASIAIVNSRLSTPLVWTTPAPWVQQGVPGTAATVAVGTTTTLSPGSSATVANSGTSSAAVFNFGIPQGAAGATGSPGAAATVSVGSTTTGAPGTSAAVSNSGTSSAAVFDFTIPRGDVGATGATGATGAQGVPGINWLGTWNSGTTYAIRDAVAYLGSSYYATAASTNQAPPNASFWNLLAEKGENGSGSGSVTSVDVSGGTTGLTTSGGPVTSAGTITLAGTLAVANGGTGATTAGGALTNLGAIGTIASADASIVVTQVGTAVDLSVSTTSPASVLVEQVRNITGATLTKGTAVYISGATGQIPTVSKALATGDATSAQTLGLITADIANNANGFVTIIGLITNLDTSAYTDGQQLYLSPTTAGTLTATKPYAPQHLVYMAVVSHAHPTQGKLIVKVQNGYELDELHNVSAQTPTTGQTIVWNSATSLWEKNTVSLTAGVNGTLPVANGGTGLTAFTANGVFYASSTSAITTGGALTFDGSQLSVNGGAGGIPLSLDANTGGNTNLFFSEGGVAKWYLRNITGNGGFSFYDVNAGSESIRLTATGLGIGTSSPAAKLDVAGDYKEGVVTANTGTAYTISLASGTVQILTLTGNCTFTFPTATAGKSFTLLLRQDGTGGRTVTWPAAVKWPGGTAPTITNTASRQDKYIFTADGTNWYGSNAGQNYTV